MAVLSYARAIILPILLAYTLLYAYRQFSPSQSPSPAGPPPIPVGAILSSALRKTDVSNLAYEPSPWEVGLMYHGLVMLQNPELTPYAGVGYGFDLRVPNPGAVTQAYPGGRLPRADGRGRYDDWGRVKGLRWITPFINSDPWKGGLLRLDGGVVGIDGGGGGAKGQWAGVSVLDQAGLGPAALLLEAAGAEDWEYPMPPGSGRNAFGEAVDRVVGKLFDEKYTRKVSVDKGYEGRTRDGSAEDNGPAGQEEEESSGSEQFSERRWVLGRACQNDGEAPGDHAYDRKGESDCGVFPQDMFTILSLLADYAIARQNVTWLVEAVEMFKGYHDPRIWLGGDLGEDEGILVFNQLPEYSTSHKEHVRRQSLRSAAYASLSATRLRFILTRWEPPEAAVRTTFNSTASYATWRDDSLQILAMITETIWLRQQTYLSTRLGEIDTTRTSAENKSTNITLGLNDKQDWADDMPYVAMLISSRYQICTLSKRRPDSVVEDLYASIAREASEASRRKSVIDISLESQIAVLISYASRRDHLAVVQE